MSLLDKIIHNLDDQNTNVVFYENEIDEIKKHIKVLLNTRLDDCISVNKLGFGDIYNINIGSSELCATMANEIHRLITNYENRIKILFMSYDNQLNPWQLSFYIHCNLIRDRFNEFEMCITFRNNRYCEVS